MNYNPSSSSLYVALFLLFSTISLGCNTYDKGNNMEDTLYKKEKCPYSIEVPYYEVPFFKDRFDRNHFDERNGCPIKYLVMHYTVANNNRAMKLFTEDKAQDRVSAHYLVTEKEDNGAIPGGDIIRVVPEEKNAWHAGFSQWQNSTQIHGCEKGINRSSIGIELINKGFTKKFISNKLDWYPFDEIQIKNLGLLSSEIVKKHEIHPTCVVGHADIGIPYGRKQDPGILFPWGSLYRDYKVGAWLDGLEVKPEYCESKFAPKEKFVKELNVNFMSQFLHDYGYTSLDRKNADPKSDNFLGALAAFQAHFSKNCLPDKYQSSFDIEDQKWAYGLVAKYKK